MEHKTFHVAGLKDEATAEHLTQALQEVWGIRRVDEVSLARGEVTFSYDERAASLGDFEQALHVSGFDVTGGDTHGDHL
ncbi:MAG TPA: heavy-metal-associated domain-containing protein [Bacilli bacterium]|nr:heavy-metal-associated domain-containing protein [Bacilli bacterium]